jgi:hypothetical protein
MHVARRVVKILLAVGLAVIAVGLALRMYLGRPAEDRLDPDEVVGIAELHRPLARPSFLACPPGYCVAADMESPIFPMPWDQLREYWKEIAEIAAITVWFLSLSTGVLSIYRIRRYFASPITINGRVRGAGTRAFQLRRL